MTHEEACKEMRAILRDLVLGADMMLIIPDKRPDSAFRRYASEVKRVAEVGIAIDVPAPPKAPEPAKPRWKCPSCGSTDVEVQYGVWYTETDDYELTETGSEMSGVEYHYCNACDHSDSGEPRLND